MFGDFFQMTYPSDMWTAGKGGASRGGAGGGVGGVGGGGVGGGRRVKTLFQEGSPATTHLKRTINEHKAFL